MKLSISIIHIAFKLSLGLFALLLGLSIVAQDFKSLDELDEGQTEIGITSEKFQHHHMALSFGFESSESYTNSSNTTNSLNVPTLGLKYTYWLDDGLGFGLKSILGLADYQVKNGDTSLIERKYPISASVQMLFNPAYGLLFFIGPGIEIEKHKNFFIFDLGLGYRLKIWKQFDIKPEVYYCFKQAGIGSYGINLNLGWRFGE